MILCLRWGGHDFTGHNSPLYALPDDFDPSSPGYQMNTNFSMNYWLSLGARKDQLVMGVGAYGRGFKLTDANNNGFYAPASGPICKASFTATDGFWGYNELCEKLKSGGKEWEVHRVNYLYSFTLFRPGVNISNY